MFIIDLPSNFVYETYSIVIPSLIKKGRKCNMEIIYSNVVYDRMKYSRVRVEHVNDGYIMRFYDGDSRIISKIIRNYNNEGFIEMKPVKFSY